MTMNLGSHYSQFACLPKPQTSSNGQHLIPATLGPKGNIAAKLNRKIFIDLLF
jgi:hypothetical protein